MNTVVCTILLPLLLLGSLLGSYDPTELGKVGNLARHYVHHVQDHGESTLSFFDFLADHFSGSMSKDEEHESLPLLGGCSSAATSAEVPAMATPLAIAVADAPPCMWMTTDGAPHFRTLDVFQPPRLG